jgi:hypothetical protein
MGGGGLVAVLYWGNGMEEQGGRTVGFVAEVLEHFLEIGFDFAEGYDAVLFWRMDLSQLNCVDGCHVFDSL